MGGSQADSRAGDRAGWQRLDAHLKAYERTRAGAQSHLHVVRPGDVAALDAVIAAAGSR